MGDGRKGGKEEERGGCCREQRGALMNPPYTAELGNKYGPAELLDSHTRHRMTRL
jgi:hypothetical protein